MANVDGVVCGHYVAVHVLLAMEAADALSLGKLLALGTFLTRVVFIHTGSQVVERVRLCNRKRKREGLIAGSERFKLFTGGPVVTFGWNTIGTSHVRSLDVEAKWPWLYQ